MACIVLFSAAACSEKKAGKSTVSGNGFEIQIENECDAKIYGVHYEYYLAQKAVGGGETGYANGSAIPEGDVITLDFLPKDFPEDTDLSSLSVEIFVQADGREVPADNSIDISAQYGKAYHYKLSGSDSGFVLNQAN
mgnify:CR=1 FL=1